MAQDNNYQQTSIKRSPDHPEAKAEQLREDIERTRSALSEDVKALSERLSPEHLKEDTKEVIQHAGEVAREGAKHIVRDAKDAAVESIRHAKDHAFDSISYGVGQVAQRARAVGHDVGDFVSIHAVPLTLLGLGAGWLLMNMSHQRRLQLGRENYRYGTREFDQGAEDDTWTEARERAGRAADAVGEGVERMRERAEEVGSKVAERAGEIRTRVTQGAAHLGHEAAALGQRAYEGTAAIGHQAYERMERASQRAVEVGERNPLMIGLLALGAGVAVAMLLPPTRPENRLMGKTRDQLIHRAQDSASELKNSLQSGAQDVREAISELSQTGHHA